MQDGVIRAARTVAVLSAAYASSVYVSAEWQAAWSADPTGAQRRLLVARVANCALPGVLGQVVSFDLFDMAPERARDDLLRYAGLAVSGKRAKPADPPPFPPGRPGWSDPGSPPGAGFDDSSAAPAGGGLLAGSPRSPQGMVMPFPEGGGRLTPIASGPRGAGNKIDFRDGAYHGPVRWWKRRTTALVAAMLLLVATGGGYAVHLAAAGGSPSEIPVPLVMNPGNAKLPSDTQIQAAPECSGVQYHAGTKDQFLEDFQDSQRTGAGLSGAEVGGEEIDITNQTSSSESVLLMGMRVLVLQRKPAPTTGIVVSTGGCGSGIRVRPFSYDLDKTNSPIIAKAFRGGPSAVTFPFKVSPNDPEVFRLAVRDTTCDCRIAVEIDWVVAGKAGKTLLNNGGAGFWIVAAPTVPAYKIGDGCGSPNSVCQLIPARYQEVVRSP